MNPIPPSITGPLFKYGLLALSGALLILAFIWWLDDQKDDAVTKAVADERGKQAGQTLNQVETANNAAEVIRSSPDARRAECLRHARNPEDC